MNINLELYKVFYYVAKNENITRASNELSISQPAISKSIKTLEDQINSPLFIRKRDGVELTEVGAIIYEKVKKALELIDSAEDDIKSLTTLEKGSINIGASKTIIHEYLMPYIKEFHNKYPNINIRVFTDKTSDLLKKAKLGLIDIIFTNLPYKFPSDFEVVKLLELHDCFVACNEFSDLKGKLISYKDLETLPLLLLTKGATTRIQFDDYCVEKNISVHPEMEFGSNTLIKEFTEAGFGIGILTEEFIKEELDSGKLFKINLDVPLNKKYIGMAFDSSKKGNTITNTFIKYVSKKNQ